jgi:Fe-S-cluster containining protein
VTPGVPEPDTVTASFRMNWHGCELEAGIPVPTGPVRPRVLLPVLQAFTNAVVGMAERVAADNGEAVSCRAGCGACCRQLVPVSESEAHHLRELVDALPEPRRGVIRERFAAAERRLAEAGLLERLGAGGERPRDLGRDYFALGIACPFLEEESCSIHPDRPLACREYLVLSPPEQCANPSGGGVVGLPLPGSPSVAFARLDGPGEADRPPRWMPLTLAPGWAEGHPEQPATEAGTALFAAFMEGLRSSTHPLMPSWQPAEES